GETAFRISELERAAITIRRARVNEATYLWRQWSPWRVAHRRKRSRRSSAVRMTQHDDFVTAGGELRRVHGGVVRLGAAVGEKGFLEFAGCDLRELFGKV